MLDLTGKKYGKLTVIGFSRKETKISKNGTKYNKFYWQCQCECGKITEVMSSNLTTGKSKSCGCVAKEKNLKRQQEIIKELINTKFGSLKVIAFDHFEKIDTKNKGTYYRYFYKCKCDCGNEVIVERSILTTGQKKSCGCLSKEMQKKLLDKKRQENFEELSKRKYGRLTVIGFDHIERKNSKNNKDLYYRYWKCKCDCGNEISVIEGNLKRGTTRSCGCLEKDLIKKRVEERFVDISGKKYGKLTAISMIRKKDSRGTNAEYWKCRCDCGNETIVLKNSLVKNKVKSCGCEKSRAGKEFAIMGRKILRKNFLKEGTDLTKLSNVPTKSNKSGVRGVSILSKKNKFKASIYFKGKCIELGVYDTLQKAAIARGKAEEKYFKPILEKYNYTPKNVQENKKIVEDEEEIE